MHPLVSIIVPVYNAQNTIKRCIDSILQQTYDAWELILINDGSNDNSFSISLEYSKSDQRIKVFSQCNSGVSSARNHGLRVASGVYVVFVDSDDWVLPDYVNHLVDDLNNYKTQFAMGYPQIISTNKGYNASFPANFIEEDNWDIAFVENKLHWNTSPWGKIYNLELIKQNELCFNEGMNIGEDAVFLFQYLLLVDSLFISNHTDYCYFYDSPGSLTKKIFDVKSELISYQQIYQVLDQLINKKKLTSLKTKDCLNRIKGSYVRRVLNSLYHNLLSYSQRKKIYLQLDVMLYVNYIKPDSYKEKFLQVLLYFKLFCFYDLIRKIAILIK